MKHVTSHGLVFASLTLLGLGTGALIIGYDKRHHD